MSRFEDLGCIFQLLAWVKESQEESILICDANWPDKVELVVEVVCWLRLNDSENACIQYVCGNVSQQR